MRITILGTGAMACLFGARLARLADVTLAGTWPVGLAALQAAGIVLEEAGTDTSQPVEAVPLGQPVAPADLVLVLVKAWQTESVAPHVPRLLKPEGVAVTLQNGLGNLEKLGPRTCLGVTTQGATLLGPGHVRSCGAGPTQIAGPAWIADVLGQAGFEAHPAQPAEVDGLAWGKLAVNCGINALTALLRVTNGELLARPETQRLMERAAAECAAVAGAKGVALPYADAATQVCQVARRTAINRSSMFQDILRGAPTEIDAINGAVVQEGRRLKCPTPINETLWQLVRVLVKAG